MNASNHKNITTAVALGMLMLFPACDGMFEGVYDDVEGGSDPTNKTAEIQTRGTLTIDATAYTEWHYINFHSGEITTSTISLTDSTESGKPAEWDVALHRYDVKSNNGVAIETEYTTIDELLAEGLPTDDEWTADTFADNKITIDMSHMMEGYLVYLPDYYNPILSKWVDVNTSTMPPIYTMNQKVFVVRLSDDTHLALRLINFMNDKSVKGNMNFEYYYPLPF